MAGVKITPLGGLGEIGLNMMMVESMGEAIVIDCGLMFPEPHMPGIDIVIPQFQHILEEDVAIKGIFLTHGHEDHIGALPFLLKHIKPPVYGTSLTLGLIEKKLREHELAANTELIEVNHTEAVASGPFSVQFIRVCHSIPDCSALAINTPQGVIIHSGDFKFDDTPVDSKRADYATLSRYGKDGVLALLSDSTNVEMEGRAESDKVLTGSFNNIFKYAEAKIIVALFSSNINRIQQILDVSELYGRKVVLIGRSLVSNVRIARERGYLNLKDTAVIDVKKSKELPADELTIITTGSQGEPMSGLSLMAAKSHSHVTIEDADKVILSSKSVPGNEKLICNIINQLSKSGAEVFYERVAKVHVSGHGHVDDLKIMISLTNPRYFVPVHGEYRHLVRHKNLALEMGIPDENTLLVTDGETIHFDEDGVEIESKVKAGRVFVDGKSVGDVHDLVLRDRLHLANDGMVIAVVAVNSSDCEAANNIELFSKGFTQDDAESEIIEEARNKIKCYLEEARIELKTEWSEMEAEIGILLKRFFKKKVKRRPVIIPVIMEM